MENSQRVSGQPVFAATRWSLVAGLQRGETDRRHCMVELLQNYFFPVYAYIRRVGHADRQAYDLGRAFFGHLVQRLGDEQPEGRFREFLLNRLSRFLAAPEPLRPQDEILPVPSLASLEARLAESRGLEGLPERIFEGIFAREVLRRSLARLRQEAERNGRAALYETLVGYLTCDPGPGEMQDAGQRLNVAPLALVVSLKGLRARFADLVRQELAETVSTTHDLKVEQESIRTILHRHE